MEEETPTTEIPVLEVQRIIKRKRPGLCYLCDHITEVNWRPREASYKFACCYVCASTYLGYTDDST